MSPHFYIVKTPREVGVFSRLRDAKKAADDAFHHTVWEIFDSGWSGALLVAEDGKPVDEARCVFEHDRTKEPFTLMPTAVAYTRNGKLPKALLPHE
jgi:hypothetical protein